MKERALWEGLTEGRVHRDLVGTFLEDTQTIVVRRMKKPRWKQVIKKVVLFVTVTVTTIWLLLR